MDLPLPLFGVFPYNFDHLWVLIQMDERKINIIDDETETLIVIQTSVLSHAKRRIDI